MLGNPRYRPIADYGLIGAMHTCALVSKEGSIDWCCLPAFDSPAAFCRILDWRAGGYYQVAPLDIQSVSRRYLPSTNAETGEMLSNFPQAFSHLAFIQSAAMLEDAHAQSPLSPGGDRVRGRQQAGRARLPRFAPSRRR